MTLKQSYLDDAACVLDCGGCDAALKYEISNFKSVASTKSIASIFNSFVPSLIKAIEGYSSLLKPFFKNPFFVQRSCLVFVFAFRFFPTCVNLCNTMQSYVNHLPPGGCAKNPAFNPIPAYSIQFKAIQAPPPGVYEKMVKKRRHLKHKQLFLNDLHD
jgi:hypothetical protein